MIELIIGVYGGLCWLLFKKFKIIPTNTYTVCTAIMGGVGILLIIGILLSVFHPSTNDGRLYAATVPIVSQVRGVVTEVPVVADAPLKKGDVLFKIDPRPYQIEVDRLEASLASENLKVSQLEEKLTAAEAAVREAEENVRVTESVNDRQARETLERITAQVSEIQTRVDFAKLQLGRRTELLEKKVISQEEFDKGKAQSDSVEAELRQIQSSQREAEEKLKSGGSVMMGAVEELNRAKSQAQEIRLELQTEGGDLTPKVRETMAELDMKRWELDQTVVRAPSDGTATQVILQPGQMATPFPIAPLMVFLPGNRPALIASFAPQVAEHFEPGLDAELAFAGHPGKVFKAKVNRILPIIPEGQIVASGQLRTTSSGAGRILVVFDYGDDVAALHLPIGSQAITAVYTHHVHALSIMRKIIIRIKSWESYLFFAGGHGGGGGH